MIDSTDKTIPQSDEPIGDRNDATITESAAMPFAEQQNIPTETNAEVAANSDIEEQSEPSTISEETDKSVKHAKSGKVEKSEEDKADNNGLGEFIKIGIKAVAVTLSVVFLLLAILTVAMPLSAMRTFNKLGWSERALVSGDRYITRRLKRNGADVTDDIGNFSVLTTVDLNDADMIEAYDVCIGLSNALMTETAAKGDMQSAKYFAEKLELYTRQYSSLGSIMSTNRDKSVYNIENVPDIRMRPYVYDYAHTIMLDNFRARTYTGELDKMLYDSGRSGDCVILTQTLANTYETSSIPENSQTAAAVIDGFVDYVDQLGVYLSVKFDMLGIPAQLNESNVLGYRDILDGTEFGLFITPSGGYTDVYKKLKGGFSRYAQAAADFNAVTIDDELHKLYWLQALSSASTKLWYMSMLLYFDNTGSYGNSREDIIQEYNDHTCELYKFVRFDMGDGFGSQLTELIDIYNKCMRNYLLHFAISA